MTTIAIISGTVFFTLLIVFIFFLFYYVIQIRREHAEFKQDVNYLKRIVTLGQMPSVRAEDSPSIQGLNMRIAIRRVLDEQMNIDELMTMKSDLGLNGGVNWQTKDSAVNSLIDIMIQKKRLIDVAVWLKEFRPDMRF